jgi:hypothetical protein
MAEMSVGRKMAIVAATAALLWTGAAANAQEQGPNTGRISLNAGVDFPTRYYFRGILQENQDVIIQPFADITFKLYESKGPLSTLSLTLGTWNSFHGGPTGMEGKATVDPKMWYEADAFATLTTTWFEDLTAALTYTAYMSPNDAFRTVQEMALSLSYNDAKWLGAFALNPSILFAFETTGEALVSPDGKKGIYMGIGLAPGYTFFADSSFPVNVSAPMTFGFSLKDYYTVNGQNQTFGYFSGGPLITMPLKFIPSTFGNWSLKAGVQFLVLNSNLKAVNTNDSFVPIGSVGLSLTY